MYSDFSDSRFECSCQVLRPDPIGTAPMEVHSKAEIFNLFKIRKRAEQEGVDW